MRCFKNRAFRHSFFLKKLTKGAEPRAESPLSFSFRDVVAFACGVQGHGCT
jgi:hypothetical protein